MTNQELGALGETIATNYLEKKGYEVLDRNYRFGHLEIDIVTTFENKLVVVEVKTRQTAEIGQPWEAVTRGKQKQIIKATNFYIQERDVKMETQFDVISIVHNTYRSDLEHIIDAFYPM